MRMFTAGCASEQQLELSSCRPGNTRHAVHHKPAALLDEPLSFTKLLPSKLEGENMPEEHFIFRFFCFFYNVKMSSGLNATAATAATANSRLTRLTRRVRLTATFFVHSGALWGFHGWQEETGLVAIKRRLIKFLSWLHWMAVLCSEYVCSCVYVRVRGSECANIRQHPPAAFGVQQGVWTNVVLRPTRSRSN